MRPDIETLQDLFKIGYEAFEASRKESKIVTDLYHNRHYTDAQLATLERRGQPKETFNVVKLFARLLVGYYSTVVNTVQVAPRQESDLAIAQLLNDLMQFTLEDNHFSSEGDKIKLDGILSGVMCVFEDVVETGRKDPHGRPIRRVQLSHVPVSEIVLDPMSRLEDYSDARYVHRFKWVSEDYLKTMLKAYYSDAKIAEILKSIDAYNNHVNQTDTDFYARYEGEFVGKYKVYNNYLLVHTVVVDEDGKAWSVFWCGDEILLDKEVTYKQVRFPYRIQRVHSSDQAEYYGLFREVIEAQHSINQAIIKIQLMVNSQRAFVAEGAVEDLDEFTDAFNRVNSIIQVKKLAGIQIENVSSDVQQQYIIIDNAFNRIQKVLGINDSFLGMAFASDSGRKVKLQQNATTLALRYLTTKIEQFYRLLGQDIVNLVKQFYTAYETLRIVDNVVGQRWVTLNKPMEIWTGEFDPQGQPVMTTPMEEVLDPESGEPLIVDGNFVIAPIPEQDTEIAFSEVDIRIDTVAYDDSEEQNQRFLETVLQGAIGQTLMQFNPAAFLKAAALSIRTVRTKHSTDIAALLDETAQMLLMQQQQMPQPPQDTAAIEAPKSKELKLPEGEY